MRPISIQKRKNRIIYQRLFYSIGIFLFSLLICFGIFGWQLLARIPLMSPMGKNTPGFNSDTAEYTVKKFCEEKKLTCVAVEASGDSITIVLSNNATILLSSSKDLQKQLASLQVTLSQLTIEGKQFKKLDFRFEKPFITF